MLGKGRKAQILTHRRRFRMWRARSHGKETGDARAV
jgi:hypothetical protein